MSAGFSCAEALSTPAPSLIMSSANGRRLFILSRSLVTLDPNRRDRWTRRSKLICRRETACICNRQTRELTGAELVPGFTHGAEQGRPIFEIGGEDFFHHPPRELRHQYVQHYR